ncbi:MAG: FAD binding domain-containing protein [Aeromicrobium sp.]
MIPSAFDYQAPTSVDDALAALAAGGDDAKILAGGQSLIPVLKLRLAAPETVIDLGRIAELQGVSDDGDAIVIGAMTPHHVVATDPLVAENAALLAQATQTVADPQVRHRGTFGGALAHADPAGDLLAPALALDAEFEIAGSGGRRTVPASEFFVDLFTTAVGEDEILTRVRVPKTTGWKSDYQKFTRVAQQWSIVGVAAAIRVEGDSIAEARIGLTNMGSTPVRASAVEQALGGCALDEAAIAAATASAGEGTNPPSDTNGDAAFRRHLAGVLTARAVCTAGGVVSTPAGAA